MISPGPQRQEILAVAAGLRDRLILPRIADIEIGERQRPLACRSGNVDLGVERQQRRREIAAEGGKAHAAALRRHMADVAGGLEAMMVGGPPPFALIVEDAAGIERRDCRRPCPCCDASARRCDAAACATTGIVPHHVRVRRQLGQRHRRADLERMRIGLDVAQLGDVS